ncbi:hypothetical protein ACGFIU_24925 [Rhodococcus oryzae]|uniref:hypothetical protein n=1 Tax=Rhodococcus oryzae TaxID=2571143 RepID=UPI00371CD9F1
MTVASLVAGVAGAIFALLAWLTSRQRQPFTLKRDGNLALLTRARRPTVQVRRVFVHGHSQLITADLAGTAEWRILSRDAHLILSLGPQVQNDWTIPAVSPSETVIVEYRRLWPWDLEAPRRWLPQRYSNGPGENKNKRQVRRAKLDRNDSYQRTWKLWHSSLL